MQISLGGLQHVAGQLLATWRRLHFHAVSWGCHCAMSAHVRPKRSHQSGSSTTSSLKGGHASSVLTVSLIPSIAPDPGRHTSRTRVSMHSAIVLTTPERPFPVMPFATFATSSTEPLTLVQRIVRGLNSGGSTSRKSIESTEATPPKPNWGEPPWKLNQMQPPRRLSSGSATEPSVGSSSLSKNSWMTSVLPKSIWKRSGSSPEHVRFDGRPDELRHDESKTVSTFVALTGSSVSGSG
mmetsp:Transcript_26589/g.106474  ORF Transcript_26589/g.106474 Transcript_26589/m.106474 type:complete len:238 (-) Transcript_26589:276-989(-)